MNHYIIVSFVVTGVLMTTDDKEEIAMAECGSCRAVIPLDSNECPECGISFSGVSEESLENVEHVMH